MLGLRAPLQRLVKLRAVQRVMSTEAPRPYALKPLPKFGAEVTGIDLKEEQPHAVVDAIREDVTK
jgi:hypothetical protein